MHPQFVGAESQAANWKKIKDLLSEAIIRKCAAQLRIIYNEISKSKVRAGGLLDNFVDTLKNQETLKEFTVDLKSVLLLSSVQPTFLGKMDKVTKNGIPLAELLTKEQISTSFPQLKDHQLMLSMAEHLLRLKESVGHNIEFVQGLMGDITRIKKEGSLSSKIYDEMIIFVINVKKEINGQIIKETVQELVRLYKAKKIQLDSFLQEALAYCLLASFGEFWDYASCLYQNERNKQSETLLLRSDERLRTYIQEFFLVVQQQIYPVVVAEKNADMLFNSYSFLNDLSTLPVTPKESPITLSKPLELAFNTVCLFLPFKVDTLHDLFSDQLFCYFYSLFKQSVDGMLRDYKVTLNSMALNVYNQVIQRFDKSTFSTIHATTIDPQGDQATLRDLYFRPIKVTRYLLENCSKRVSTTDLQRLAYDCIEASTRLLFECSDQFKDKMDAFLFILKNLVYIYVFLATSFDSQNSTVRLSQLNYNPRSSGLESLFAGRLDLATIGGVLYDLVPRMSEYKVDLRANMRQAVEHVLDRIMERGISVSASQVLQINGLTKNINQKIEAVEEALKAIKDEDQGKKTELQAEIIKLKADRSKMVDADAVSNAAVAFEHSAREFLTMLLAKCKVYLDEDSAKLIQEELAPLLLDSLATHLQTLSTAFELGVSASEWKASLLDLIKNDTYN
jgi:hypothetical protein